MISNDPDTIYSLSLVITTHVTGLVCPRRTASSVLFWKFHILTVRSSEPDTMYVYGLFVTATLDTGKVWPSNTNS